MSSTCKFPLGNQPLGKKAGILAARIIQCPVLTLLSIPDGLASFKA